jgi:2-oxoisovalerate dehydrogenase E2 component (dihydrolipoyl transacylase)
MSVNEYKLPDVGEGLTEAEIVSWRVKVGDTVNVNDVVVEIETAKSLVELPSPYAGTVTALLVSEGETVAVGTPIISVSSGPAGASGEPAGQPAGEPAEEPAREPAAGAPAVGGAAEEEPMKTLVGYGPRSAAAQRRPRKGGATPRSEAGSVAQEQLQGAFTPGPVGEEEVQVEVATEAAVPAQPAAATAATGRPPVLAKPPVRKLAKDLGVDLRAVTPSGPQGTVTRDDVHAARTDLSGAATAIAAQRPDKSEREVREPIKGVRKTMAQAMVDSAFTAPHVTEWVTVDVTRTTRLVARLREHRDFQDVRVSPLLVVAKAVCLAVRRTPEVNATWDDAAQEVVFKSYVNLGIAAATPRGLVVPNVKDADQMSMVELAAALGELTGTAREGRTQPAEMAGGTFTITNVGVFGVDAGTPILNPGESAILCLGAVRKQPWVHKGRVRPRDVTTLALSFDHRLVDGEKGSRFLADVAAILEDPASALTY